MSDSAGYVCAHCGAVSAAWTQFCEVCGTPRTQGASAPGQRPRDPWSSPTGPAADAASDAAAAAPPQPVQPLIVSPNPGIASILQGGPISAPAAGYAAPGAPGAVATAAPPMAVPAPAAVARYTLGPGFEGLTAAGAGRRVAAFAIDLVLAGAASTGGWLLTGSLVVAALVLVEIALVQLVWEANTGRTVGNLLLRMRTTRSEEPTNSGLARAVVRGLVVAGGTLVAGIGQWVVAISTAFDQRLHRGWHDLAGRTVVVLVPAGRRPTTRGRAVAGERLRAPRDEPAPETAPVAAAPETALVPSGPLFTALGETMLPGRTGFGGTGFGATGLTSGAATGAMDVGAADAALSAEDEERERAEAIRLITPTVLSTRMTVAEVDEDSLEREAAHPSIPVREITAGTPVLLLTVDTGQRARVPVPGTGVLGRTPREFNPGDTLIRVEDPDKSVSKSHLLYQVTEDAIYVLDHASTNGSEIIDDQGRATRLPADEWVPLPDGARVRIGRRTITPSRIEGGAR